MLLAISIKATSWTVNFKQGIERNFKKVTWTAQKNLPVESITKERI